MTGSHIPVARERSIRWFVPPRFKDQRLAKVAGIDHVGIRTDFDGIQNEVPKGLEDASKMPVLAAALRKRGYSEADVEKVMGGNFLRVIRQVIGK